MPPQSRHMVVATAGHIDHGKTALVRALTGMETDRLAEEKRRGITIELGFAFLGDDITIIDVPGHERFIKTMVAGVATVDLGLLIVAADDAVMPQTREHLAILDLLGIPDLFVVITKIESQRTDWLDLVEQEVREILPERYRSEARFFRCDSLSGRGVEELKEAMLAFQTQLPPRSDRGVFRSPVDRAFTVKGYGTVVTGTILAGTVNVGDRLQVMPLGSEVRVRGLQSHGQDVQNAGVGVRTAINLTGPDADKIERGDWICTRDAFLATDILDIKFVTLNAAFRLKNRERVRLHIGTAETIGRLVLFGQEVVNPGETCYAQIVCEAKLTAARSDRFVLRRYSPPATIGGGEVLDPVPVRKRRSDPEAVGAFSLLDGVSDDQALVVKVRISGTIGLQTAMARAFMNVPPPTFREQVRRLTDQGKVLFFGSEESGILASAGVIDEAEKDLVEAIEAYHRKFPQLLGIKQASLISELSTAFPEQVVEKALEAAMQREIVLEKGFLHSSRHTIQLDEKLQALSARLEKLLVESGFNAPGVDVIRKRLRLTEPELNAALDVMQQQGRVVRMADGSPWAMSSVQKAWRILYPLLADNRGKTIAELREALGCPRRYAVALLGYLDREGLTERREDLRFPGPEFERKLLIEE